MFFITLGINNAWRNLSRSLLAIVSMSLAAGFLTYSLTLSQGYTLLFKQDCRSIIGGEIIVYARQFGGIVPSEETSWRHSFIAESPSSDLLYFHPELLKSGYLSSEGNHNYFSGADIEELTKAIPGISYLYPRYQLPAKRVDVAGLRLDAPLRGRDTDLDNMLTEHPSELIMSGRWLGDEDDGEYHAVVSYAQLLPQNVRVPALDTTVVIEVPRVIYFDDQPVFIESEPKRFEFTIVGQLLANTRYIGDAPQYWALPEVLIPLSTWQQIWLDIGGREYRPEQITLGYPELNYLEDVIYELRSLHPEFSFYSFADHFQQAEHRGLIEIPNASNQAMIITADTQSALPLDFRVPFTLMIFLNAALVVASNLLIMVSERKREIAILKAVGMENKQVLGMILTEGLLISMVGVAFGFVFFRFPATLQEMTNHLSGFVILKNIAIEGLIISGATAAFAILFGILPGTLTARLPVMEVLRKE